MAQNLPNNTATSHLADFLRRLRAHTDQAIRGFPSRYASLVQIDALFKKLQENSDFSKEWFAILFLLRAHSSFLAGVSVALSGQIPEAYMVLRGCLENSIYGLYLSRHDEHAEIWLQRNNDQESKKKAKDIFKISTLLSFLATLDAESGRVAKVLYDRTIDLGAHPNDLALLSALRMQRTPARDDLLVAYISGDPLTNELSLKTAFEIGLCSLSIFRNVLKERYDILGITEQLEALKRGGA